MTKQIEADEKQPFLSHLKELRDRILVCVIAVGIAFVITYRFKEKIFAFLMEPFVKVMPPKSFFIFTGITEAFITYFKIAIVSAVFLALPVMLYEFWKFVSPGLYEKEKRYVYPFIVWGSFCFLLGLSFCYFLVLPFVYKFFVGYSAEFIVPMPDLKGYMAITLKMLTVFGIIFGWSKLKIVTICQTYEFDYITRESALVFTHEFFKLKNLNFTKELEAQVKNLRSVLIIVFYERKKFKSYDN